MTSVNGLRRPALAAGVRRDLPAAGMGVARRLVDTARSRLARRPAAAANSREPDVDSYCSILDLGTGAIKALVIELGGERTTVLAARAEPRPAPNGAAPPEDLVAAAERALVAAEDAAGVVPRRVALGLPSADTWLGTATVETLRPRTTLRITGEEVVPLLTRARRGAITAAARIQETERGRPGDLVPVNALVTGATIDERPVSDPTGLGGRRLGVTVAVACAASTAVRAAHALADALDLELAALTCESIATAGALVGGPDVPALIIDVGAHGTGLSLAGARGVEAALTFPIGGAALLAGVADRLGLAPDLAQDAVIAHTAGAGQRAAGSAAAGRVVRQVAEHFAGVWLEGFQVACETLSSGRTLPPRLHLCGGAAGLPELRHALSERAWQLALPFEHPPAIRLLTPADVPGTDDRSFALPALQAVPPLCLAAVAGGTALRPSALDKLLQSAPAPATKRRRL